MEQNEFAMILDNRIVKMRDGLITKGKEYARGDRLSNFKKAASAMSCTPEKACVSFWMKHVISINDIVNDLDKGVVAPMSVWEEKIGDGIAYLVLLEAQVRERLK